MEIQQTLSPGRLPLVIAAVPSLAESHRNGQKTGPSDIYLVILG